MNAAFFPRGDVRQVLECASPLALCRPAQDGRRLPRLGGKAVEDYRSPRRFAITAAVGKSVRFWTAPVLWGFGNGRGSCSRLLELRFLLRLHRGDFFK